MTRLAVRRLSTGPLPIALLVLVHVALLVDGARRDAITFDEPAFLSGAVACWQENDYRLSPDGGALPQRLQGLGLLALGLRVPTDGEAWRGSDAYALGRELLYGSGRSPREVAFAARLPVALLSVALALLVHALASRLFGRAAGLLSLSLYSLSPIALAHGRLATADLAISLTMLAAIVLVDGCLRRLTWTTLLLSCAATAAAFVSKFSALLLVPMAALLVVLRLLRIEPLRVELGGERRVERRGERALALAAIVVAHAAVTVGAIWAIHGLRWQAFREGADVSRMKDGGWPAIENGGAVAPLVSVARRHHLLPEAWLFGLQFTSHHAQSRRAYAAGRYSQDGWWWFFPRLVAVKTPLGALALLVLGPVALGLAWRRGVRLTRACEPDGAVTSPPAIADLVALSPLLVLIGVYGAVALGASLNIGLRHVLPGLAPALVLAGAAARLGDVLPRMRLAPAALAVVAVLEGLTAHPDHLAWMNALAGAPAGRWRQAADSSLDWGQGLGALARELPGLRRPGETAWLAYFGTGDPARESLAVEALASYPYRWRRGPGAPLGAGLYCISATSLVQLWSRSCPGPWSEEHERQWQQVLPLARRILDAGERERQELLQRDGAPYWSDIVARHEELASGRLGATLRGREPDAAIAGGAILVYRLEAEDVRGALEGAPPELVPGLSPLAGEPFTFRPER